ncbi:hypothetical protein HHS_00210 [Candidatus Pantoea carbekii]|uniref:Uncharacterized protein n=1 Tax=Candidatus Pantoea carbekii TaxID=1235990 RepID=U3U1J5_9GAMM|nr:hypothetical protein HHS_00210 [Candidatus Pantoea carbekii]
MICSHRARSTIKISFFKEIINIRRYLILIQCLFNNRLEGVWMFNVFKIAIKIIYDHFILKPYNYT